MAATLLCGFNFKSEVKKVNVDNLYLNYTTVYLISETTDTVMFQDNFGYLWLYKGIKNFEEGDKCILLMDNKGTVENTEDILDDEIVKVFK